MCRSNFRIFQILLQIALEVVQRLFRGDQGLRCLDLIAAAVGRRILQAARYGGVAAVKLMDHRLWGNHPVLFSGVPHFGDHGDGIRRQAGPTIAGEPLVMPDLIGVVPLQNSSLAGPSSSVWTRGFPLPDWRTGPSTAARQRYTHRGYFFVVELIVHEGQVDVVGRPEGCTAPETGGCGHSGQSGPAVDQLPVEGGQKGHVHTVRTADGQQGPLPPPAWSSRVSFQRGHHPLGDGNKIHAFRGSARSA